MFYRNHMKYLRDTDLESTYMPPDEFKTRRQFKHAPKPSKEAKPKSDGQHNFNIKFQKKENDEFHGVHRFKKAAHMIQDVIMLEHFSSNHEKDWILQKEAGVVFWLNKNTGEVSTVRPWVHGDRNISSAPAARDRGESVRKMSSIEQRRASTAVKGPRADMALPTVLSEKVQYFDEDDGSLVPQEDEPEVEIGTGALVYDGTEMDNLFALLDDANGTSYGRK
jgi:hypothetical protein